MLRIYFLQQWYALSDEALEDAIYDSQAMRDFVGIGLAIVSVPDTRRPHVVERFRAGVEAMCERLSPRLVIVYGRSPVAIDAPTLEITPDWHRLRDVNRRPRAGERRSCSARPPVDTTPEFDS